MNEDALLSIVVGTYNRKDQLQACLESIARETTSSYIVYVTDAGSTDGTVEYLHSIGDPRIRPVLVGKPIGQARAYNEVFDVVTTPYVCWLSDDNVIVDRGLDIAVRALREHPRIGLIALKVRDKQGPFTAAPYIGGFSALGILNVNQGMLPTRVMHQVGGFGEVFRDYGIDPDLTAKVLFSGYDVVYSRRVAIHHYRNWSSDRSSPEYKALFEKQARGMRLYEAKYGGLLPRQPVYEWRKRGWAKFKAALGKRWKPDGRKRVAGLIPRDWNNIWNGRCISLLDPLITWGKPFHLRQRIPRSIARIGCPPDPEPISEAAGNVDKPVAIK